MPPVTSAEIEFISKRIERLEEVASEDRRAIREEIRALTLAVGTMGQHVAVLNERTVNIGPSRPPVVATAGIGAASGGFITAIIEIFRAFKATGS